MALTPEENEKVARAEEILGYSFENKENLLTAITHPSAIEGRPFRDSYERLEFLGDSILGSIVATAAFTRYPDLDEGGLTRIKVALVSGASLSALSEKLGFADVIVFGSSEAGTGKRGLHSALENVYEAIVAALYIDGGPDVAKDFVVRTLLPIMSKDMAIAPENPKSELQERMQATGLAPTYRLLETLGPPHDRVFVAQVFTEDFGMGKGEGRTKKEAESNAARATLAQLEEYREQFHAYRKSRKAENRPVPDGE